MPMENKPFIDDIAGKTIDYMGDVHCQVGFQVYPLYILWYPIVNEIH